MYCLHVVLKYHIDSHYVSVQAVREADAAVEQATRIKTGREAANREANHRVSDLLGDLNRLQQSQSKHISLVLVTTTFQSAPTDLLGSR